MTSFEKCERFRSRMTTLGITQKDKFYSKKLPPFGYLLVTGSRSCGSRKRSRQGGLGANKLPTGIARFGNLGDHSSEMGFVPPGAARQTRTCRSFRYRRTRALDRIAVDTGGSEEWQTRRLTIWATRSLASPGCGHMHPARSVKRAGDRDAISRGIALDRRKRRKQEAGNEGKTRTEHG